MKRMNETKSDNKPRKLPYILSFSVNLLYAVFFSWMNVIGFVICLTSDSINLSGDDWFSLFMGIIMTFCGAVVLNILMPLIFGKYKLTYHKLLYWGVNLFISLPSYIFWIYHILIRV